MSGNSYIDSRVKIKHSSKCAYIRDKVIGRIGTVIRENSGSFGVLVDGKYNSASGYGAYWFEKHELEFLDNEREEDKMEGFEYVAIVNLLEDYNKKDYAFAIYKEDLNLLDSMERNAHRLVVVNARSKNNCILGTIKEIVPVELYNGNKITAEVVGIVNMDRYILAEEEKDRQAELAKKKAAIEKELEEEINKRKSVEYYEEMAKKYSDNPKLAELVAELKGLGM